MSLNLPFSVYADVSLQIVDRPSYGNRFGYRKISLRLLQNNRLRQVSMFVAAPCWPFTPLCHIQSQTHSTHIFRSSSNTFPKGYSTGSQIMHPQPDDICEAILSMAERKGLSNMD